VEYGVVQSWCSLPTCATHDGIPRNEEEEAAWEGGGDPCEHVLRLWPDP